MRSSPARVRFLATCGIVILSLALLPARPTAAERPSHAEHLLLWLLGVNTAREPGSVRKIDVNSATAGELGAVPGIERRQALRIIGERPYATLRDLARAGLSPRLIERLAAFLTVDPGQPSALPHPAAVPRRP